MHLTHLMEDTLNRRILYKKLIQNTKHREFMNRHQALSLEPQRYLLVTIQIAGYLTGMVNSTVITNHSCKSYLLLYLEINTYSECP